MTTRRRSARRSFYTSRAASAGFSCWAGADGESPNNPTWQFGPMINYRLARDDDVDDSQVSK
jgi:hypothetical protein